MCAHRHLGHALRSHLELGDADGHREGSPRDPHGVWQYDHTQGRGHAHDEGVFCVVIDSCFPP